MAHSPLALAVKANWHLLKMGSLSILHVNFSTFSEAPLWR